jgi:hypothetical protein
MQKIIIFILLQIFLYSNAFALTETEKIAKTLVITDSPSVDYSNVTINKALVACKANFCKAYKILFNYKNGNIDQEKAKKELSLVYQEIGIDTFNPLLEDTDLNDLDNLFAITLSSNRLFNDLDLDDNKLIPLWLVLQYPQILAHTNGRWSLAVKARDSAASLPSFQKLQDIMKDMSQGSWVTTSYQPWQGSIIQDINANVFNQAQALSYAPQQLQIYSQSVKNNLLALKEWSTQCIWNLIKFREFEQAFTKASENLASYYQTHYNLKKYSKNADLLLSAYVSNQFPDRSSVNNEAFSVFGKSIQPIEQLKSLKITKWNDALAIAILNNYPLETIEWIINSGADINSIYMHETPLMKAVLRPDIISLLLSKGAKVNAANKYGKTALFYAIQFGSIEAVRILLEHGANPNQALESLEKFKTIDNDFFLLEQVADFTPLVYSLRYSSNEVTQLLLKHDAKLGKANRNRIKSWAMKNNEINKEKIAKQINDLVDVN